MTREPIDYSDHNVLVDADEDRWAWRARIKSRRWSRLLYRGIVFVLGLGIVVLGLFLVPLPGPGWAIVFVGVAIWASEFEAAQRLLTWAKGVLSVWNRWLMAQAWWVKALVALATAVLVALVFWGLFALSGVPGWLPDPVERWLAVVPGLG